MESSVNSDPASLQNLNDIVMPQAVGWWPPAPGWYVLIALFLLLLAWYGYKESRRWISNRYRRVALGELKQLELELVGETRPDVFVFGQIPQLLKRTALAAYPRGEVASLTGSGWHSFLNSKVKGALFTDKMGISLETLSYQPLNLQDLDRDAGMSLLRASSHWVKHHRHVAGSRDS